MTIEPHTGVKIAPQVYVGTYGKYNSGSLAGKWVNLEDYTSWKDFHDACRKIHSDECDPGIMFQDFQGFPKDFYYESEIHESIWDWLEADEDDRRLWEIYGEHVIGSMTETTLEGAMDAFVGVYESPEDWARGYIEESGMLDEMPENLRGYIDYEAYARDASYSDLTFVRVAYDKTFVFHNH